MRRVGQQRAGHRAQRDDERVDAHLDRPPAAVLDQFAPFAHAEDDVRRDAAPAEDLDGPLPRAEVALDPALRLARRDALEHERVERLDVDADGVDPGAVDLVEHGEVVGRLELDLHRHPAAALLDRGRALGDVERAAVAAVERAGRERHVDRAVEVARGGAHLRQLGRRLDRDRLLAAGQLDAAERALLGRVPVDALLHHRRGDRVEVQQRDLPIGNAVRGLHVVDPRPPRDADGADVVGPVQQQRALVGEAQRVRRLVRVVGVHRDRERQPADPDEPGVGRPGPAAPAGDPVAGGLVLHADAERLELDEQAAVVEGEQPAVSHGPRTAPRSSARRPAP